jgi:hypothetical protein
LPYSAHAGAEGAAVANFGPAKPMAVAYSIRISSDFQLPQSFRSGALAESVTIDSAR